MVGALITLLSNELRRIWCYRWLALATSILIFSAAAGFILSRPNVYEAWGQIFVSKQTPVATATQGVSLVGDSYGSPNLVARTLLNDQGIERIIRQLDPAAAELSTADMAATVATLKSQIELKTTDEDFYEFHVKDQDPIRAQRVAELLLKEFIARNVNRNQRELRQAGDFIEGQIASYEPMIAAAKERMADFQRRNPRFRPVPTLEGGGGAPDLSEARAAYDALAAQSPARGATVTAETIAGLRAKLTALRAQYTDQYPDVIATRRQLADALATRAAEARLPGAVNPAMAAARQRLFAARRGAGGGRFLRPTLSPELQAEWADLQKNDEMLRANYQQLIAKREGARMSLALYSADGSGKYQVTRRPTVPQLPIGPKRVLFLGLALFVAIGAGLAAAYLRAAMTGVFVAPRELEQSLQLPVVGTVSWEPAWSTANAGNPGTLAAVRATILRVWRRKRSAAAANATSLTVRAP